MTALAETRSLQSGKAAVSAWIGSVLEYYDFFIYATAASLVFPQLFFSSADPNVSIVASLATYGVGYVVRPLGALFFGHLGDTRGRKTVLLLCMFLMGFATIAVGLLPTYEQVGMAAPMALVILRLIQGFAVAGEICGASSMVLEHVPAGRRGYFASFTLQGVQAGQVLAAAAFLPLAHYMSKKAFICWGWRIPFLLTFFLVISGYIIRRKVAESPVFLRAAEKDDIPRTPIAEAFAHSWRDMLRVTCMAATNVIPVVATIFGAAYAVQPTYGVNLPTEVYLWIPVLANLLAMVVIPSLGKLSDRIGRRPLVMIGSLGSGLLAFAYLHAISLQNIPWTIILALLMWGIVYQAYNAIMPSYFPELFQPRYRVSAMAIAFNTGVALSAILPALFTIVAPPGSTHIPLIVGAITFTVTLIAALAALSARETYQAP